ncbi:MAG: phosphate ABC transporter ATP-binding protein [Thermoproteota archaeon]|nr:phosphate ABC transporter ATP-binding protein [Candidatus Brockarchaeota archaeon]MBO3801159.1 phosphate ABC transporter ATP-binding protein [Candidatus Brockarchaeota archaeon]
MKAKIKIRNLSAWYGKRQVLRDINLEIPENSVTAIIGPSGGGKSTLLRCINRTHELKRGAKVSGSILIDDTDIYKVNPIEVRKKIGFVFQKPNPFPNMSVYDNVAVGLRVNGVKDEKEIQSLVEEALVKVNLWNEVKDRLSFLAIKLSGGQQQRLCIARAIVLEPEVVLMDEPTSALDYFSMIAIENLIKKISFEHTVVLSTHNIQQAARVSDYIAFIYSGQIIEYGDTKTMLLNPKDEIIKEYLAEL